MREISTQEQMSEMSEVCGATYYPPMTSRVVTTDIVSLVISRVCAEGAHNTIRCFPSAEHIGVLACNSAQSARTAGAVPYPITRPPHFPTTHPMHCAPAWRLCQMALCRRRRWLVSDRLARDTGSTQTFSVRRLPDLSPELGSESSTSSNPGLCWPAAMESDCRSSGTEP